MHAASFLPASIPFSGAALDIISGGGGLCSLYRDDSGKDSTGSASNLIELCV
jgi:hypothetical protein